MQPPPHATTPTFPEVPAEAVTVGPLVGYFLWSAGNNLKWGLDGTEKRTSEHPDTSPLSPSCPLQSNSSALCFGSTHCPIFSLLEILTT